MKFTSISKDSYERVVEDQNASHSDYKYEVLKWNPKSGKHDKHAYCKRLPSSKIKNKADFLVWDIENKCVIY